MTEFEITTDKTRLDLSLIHQFLTNSYWAKGIDIGMVTKSIENSLCFGAFENRKQIGFARLVTDYATFAYLADVFVLEEYRGKGVSKALISAITSHEIFPKLRRIMLATRDAHTLYSRYGFENLDDAGSKVLMQITRPNIYIDSVNLSD